MKVYNVFHLWLDYNSVQTAYTLYLQLSYQWQPKYYHINLQCTNVTVTQAVIRDAEEYTVYDNSLIQNESCSVSISACLKDGQGGSCQWAVNSDVHNVTCECNRVGRA